MSCSWMFDVGIRIWDLELVDNLDADLDGAYFLPFVGSLGQAGAGSCFGGTLLETNVDMETDISNSDDDTDDEGIGSSSFACNVARGNELCVFDFACIG